MIGDRVAKRYAAALFQEAVKEGNVTQVEADLRLISATLGSMPELRAFYRQPMVPPARKKSASEVLFEGKVQDLTLRFLSLLIDKRREETLPQIWPEFEALSNEALGIAVAHVTTAVPMTHDQAARLQAKLQEVTGKAVRMEARIDPAIIGGVRVRMGDTVMDGSIQGALAALSERLHGQRLARQ
ncbi:MAG: ATP synthase F1 subunit delta [Armatimonadetes bacterium]|nr:ATP synthase F1 subunit delta [Armatimonadota bacterium]